MQILIKEPENINNYYPFAETHCVWEMRSGALRLFEKISNLFQEKDVIFSGRDLQLNVFLKRESIKNKNIIENEPILEISSSFIFDINVKFQIIPFIKKNTHSNINFVFNNNILIKYISDKNHSEYKTVELKNIDLVDYLWEILDFQQKQMSLDADLLISKTRIKSIALEDSNNSRLFINSKNIFIGENVKIYPNVILDATNGPIIINNNSEIMYNSAIIGPCYIGENTVIKIGATIYENCSFGNYCKIGGELEHTIFHNYSSKQHSGFIGNSYIGEWVNLGANTNNSDLKNNYSDVSVFLLDKKINTNKIFLGFICGDHTKTSINSSISTGSIIGTAVMLAINKLTPKQINSFSWITDKNSLEYDFNKFLDTAKIVKNRRKQQLLPEEIKMFESLALNKIQVKLT